MKNNTLRENIEHQLKLLTSTSKHSKSRYKMVVISPLRYAGGKSRAIGYMLERIPRDLPSDTVFVSPFFGGGSFEIFLSKYLGVKVIGYELFDILVNYWYHQIHTPEQLYTELKRLKPNEYTFLLVREILMNYFLKNSPEGFEYNHKKKLTLLEHQKMLLDNNPLLLATYYYFNHQLSYAPMFLGWKSSAYVGKGKEKKYDRILQRVKNFEGENLKIGMASCFDSIPRHPHDFIIGDPPYYIGETSSVFKGIYPNSNFAIHHNDFDHKKFYDMLQYHKGGFLLTLNNCEYIRKLYKKYDQYFPSWHYSLGQGETRIGKNREDTKSYVKKSKEIIIVDYPH